jgi:hypothetical protein
MQMLSSIVSVILTNHVQVDLETGCQFFGRDGVGMFADSMRFIYWDDTHGIPF